MPPTVLLLHVYFVGSWEARRYAVAQLLLAGLVQVRPSLSGRLLVLVTAVTVASLLGPPLA